MQTSWFLVGFVLLSHNGNSWEGAVFVSIYMNVSLFRCVYECAYVCICNHDDVVAHLDRCKCRHMSKMHRLHMCMYMHMHVYEKMSSHNPEYVSTYVQL